MKPLFAPELVVGLARLDGRPIGIVANNPAVKGGVLFVDSADKAARFVWCCDAFNLPLLFLADVPGFMVGTQVEAQGIIRHGAKMVTAISEATVPKICVVVRKAYGAGLYAMSGPGLRAGGDHRAAHRQDRGDGARGGRQRGLRQPIAAIDDETEREAFIEEQRQLYIEDVDLLRLASELVIDAVVAARRPARRPGPPVRAGRGQGPPLQRAPPRGAAGMSGTAVVCRSSATSGHGTGCSPRRRSRSRAGCG